MRHAVATIALILAARALLAQCPNGSPPPCARVSPAPPDPGRIAVFPFRVTTADSLLGEGIAELVAEELTGEGGPKATHMGTTLRVWRRAGGGLRTPLDQPAEMRAARELGAGLVVEGSVVGLGSRLTLNAQIVAVASGRIHRANPVSGVSDSLPRMIEQLAAAVLVASGAANREAPLRLSDSPAAVRAYIEGLAHFRRGRLTAAAQAFERAIASDSLFTRASLMLWQTSNWGPGFGSDAARLAGERARRDRASLSSVDQIVLDAAFGDLAAKERAATTAPESPEAQYFLGDYLWHHAGKYGWDSSLARARVAFERSAAIDSQATVLHHLVEMALLTRDSALLRRAWTGYDRVVQGADPALGWVVAERSGDTRLVAELRRRSWAVGTEDDYLRATGWLMAGSNILPPATIEDVNERVSRAITPRLLPPLQVLHMHMLSNQGRMAAARRVAAEGLRDDALLMEGVRPDLWLAASALIGDVPRVEGSAAVARLRAAPTGDPTRDARARCMINLWDSLVRDSVVPDDGLLRDHGQAACAAILEVLAAAASDRPTRLAVADSLVRRDDPVFNWSGLGEIILARLWEAAGNPGRALALLRSRMVGFPNWSVAASYRTEGRLAALVGDTSGALRVYREYLDLRRFADAALVPQRDSVRVELDRLTHARSGP